ncbi:uncharacterized protein BDZ99DRAFT_528444 [Mytilinidion resinicola]|uniref:Uncharacterized protein n=1 Tax=Mytilinidion resinicola TaxID=574789 RepID=A0A6A6XY63_9PEZI|nr:uncharacterized protein BDZ99DRAFT_528444 [Mytilinidion resinicola]KAF2801496.1 hypothetical protein BDZ99DRAFT_528444 [Mytilinidion resinicola]
MAPFPFKSLPRNVRDDVYDLVLEAFVGTIYAADPVDLEMGIEAPLPCPPLLLVDKQINEEATATIARHTLPTIKGDIGEFGLQATEVNAIKKMRLLKFDIGYAHCVSTSVRLLEKALRMFLETPAHPRWNGKRQGGRINLCPFKDKFTGTKTMRELLARLATLLKEVLAHKEMAWEVALPKSWNEEFSTLALATKYHWYFADDDDADDMDEWLQAGGGSRTEVLDEQEDEGPDVREDAEMQDVGDESDAESELSDMDEDDMELEEDLNIA